MSEDMTFFHQATMRISGSLEIDKVVRECFQYLKDFIPLDGIMLSTFEDEIGAIMILALASDIPTKSWTAPVILPPGAIAFLRSAEETVFLDRRSDDSPVSKAIGHALGLPPFSNIVLPLKVDETRLGVVFLFAQGEDRYSSEHALLIGLLHDPFAMAMANTLKHLEVLRLKDLLDDDNRYLRRELHQISGDEVIGGRYGLRDVMEMVRQVAPLNSHVLLLGETGVGKEVIANAIHYSSSRSEGPLVRVNCGAIPESLLDSELFGHEKGAFTGALGRKRGRFERAHGGTLFLDEVGELSSGAQVRLLRVLQDNEIERVGGTETLKVDVRVITATNRNMEDMIKSRQFREDLWFRLNVFPITIPPLRRRKSDIPELVNHFIHRKTKEFNLTRHPVLAPGAMEKLQAYNWPGNVRELENIVERALIRYQAGKRNESLRFEELSTAELDDIEPQRPSAPAERPLTLDDAMRVHIERILHMTGGKIQGKDGAAAVLGVHSSTLRSRMKKMGIAYSRRTKKDRFLGQAPK